MTFDAVKSFQLKYWDQILKPWVPFGLATDHTATGYVYKTTQRWINLTQCSTLDIPLRNCRNSPHIHGTISLKFGKSPATCGAFAVSVNASCNF